MSLAEYRKTLLLYYKTIGVYILFLLFFAAGTFQYELFSKNYFWMVFSLITTTVVALPLLKKHSIQFFTFLLTIISGLFGYLTESYKPYSFSNALYSTIRLFVLDTDQVFSPDGSKFVAYPLSIEIGRWSAAIYVASTILQIFIQYFGHSFRTTYFWLTGNHFVIFGLNAKSVTLIRDLLKNKRKVLIIQDGDHPEEAELIENGAAIVKGNLFDESTYRKAGIQNACYLIALHDEDAFNLNITQAVYQYIKKSGKKEKTIPFYIQQNHTLTQSLFDSIEKTVTSEMGISLEIRPVTLHSLIARQLLDKYPLYRGYEKRAKDPKGEPFHLLFVGFGLTGQQIAIQAIQRAHYFHGHPLNITVIDKAAKKIERHWKEFIPRLEDAVQINFVEQDIELEDMVSFINGASPDFTHVYICLDTDEQDALQGMRLYQHFKQMPIFIKLQRDQHFANWLHEETSFPKVYRFGTWEDVLTEQMVINEELDGMAKLVHEFYEKKYSQIGPWEKLPFFAKNSNRAQVDHLETKLFLSELKLTHSDDESGFLDPDLFNRKVLPMLEELSIVEHRRWNAFYFINGWDTLPLELAKQMGGQDKQRKLHVCLVAWNDLKLAEKETGKPYQKYDRDTVEKMHTLATESKQFIIEDEHHR
ncbi:NAD-binding protein [Bacillus sp. JJ1609]|uniref:NAD-binding protein n=1 Tax=Bacillus sp. JJ1609 TaxID=3122977 RepID=UPI003000DE34